MQSLIKGILSIHIINIITRLLINRLRDKLPHPLIERIPVVGWVTIELDKMPPFQMYVDVQLASAFKKAYWSHISPHEPEVVTLLASILPEVKVVIDVGANIGWYTLISSAYSHIEAVYAFEPLPSLFSYLQKNIEQNQFKHVTPIQSAVGEANGNVSLYVPFGNMPLMATIKKDFQQTHYKETFHEINVPIVTLDTFVEKQEIKHVDLLKVDVETAEPQVIRGALKLIKRDSPIILCEVLSNDCAIQLNNLLRDFDYRFYRITKDGLEQYPSIIQYEVDQEWNWLLIPDSKQASLNPILGDQSKPGAELHYPGS